VQSAILSLSVYNVSPSNKRYFTQPITHELHRDRFRLLHQHQQRVPVDTAAAPRALQRLPVATTARPCVRTDDRVQAANLSLYPYQRCVG
jgi:hypothetical protein